MHTLFVSGVFNVIAHLFTKALKTLRPPGGYQTYRNYLQPWEWPKTKASTATMRNVCNVKRTKSNNEAHKMKGSASELLSIYPILAHLVQHEYLEKGVLQDEAIALIRLADIVDLLILVPRGTVDPFKLHVAITEFMGAVVTAFGKDCLTPKFHQLQHLPQQLHAHRTLISCWVHERKHKMLKRYCQDVSNTVTFEESVLGEVSAHHLFELKNTTGLGVSVGLVDPVGPNKALLEYLLECFPGVAPEHIRTSQTLRFSEFDCCSKGDVVLLKDDSGFKAGQIWWLASVYQQCVALVSSWDAVSKTATSINWFAVDAPELFAAEDILETCIWKRSGDVVTTLLPPSVRG